MMKKAIFVFSVLRMHQSFSRHRTLRLYRQQWKLPEYKLPVRLMFITGIIFQIPKDQTNNYTSFTNSQNSFELGMASLRADHSFGKASATIGPWIWKTR